MELMEQAMKLKQSQVDRERAMWNSWPAFVQNTLFHKAHVADFRFSLTDIDSTSIEPFHAALTKALSKSLALREEGNANFANGLFTDAGFRFEESVGIFTYVVAVRADWKDRGLKDEDLSLVRFDHKSILAVATASFGEDDAKKLISPTVMGIVDHLATVYCNISVCAAKQTRWDTSAAAAHYVLDHLSTYHLKAAHRLAKALVTPTTATAIHTEQAIGVLQTSLHGDEAEHGPCKSNEGVRARQRAECTDFLATLVQQRYADDVKGRAMFGGMFEKKEWKEAPTRVPSDAPEDRQRAPTVQDTCAAFDAACFPSKVSQAPIFRDTQQGWTVVERMRDEARQRYSVSSTDPAADETVQRAEAMENNLIDICAQKLFTEALLPGMGTSPCLLRLDVPDADMMHLRESEPLSFGRSVLRLFGFDAAQWNAACAAGRACTVVPPTKNKEHKLYVAIAKRCRDHFTTTSVNKMKAIDAACFLVASGVATGASVAKLMADERTGEARIRAQLSSLRDKYWGRRK